MTDQQHPPISVDEMAHAFEEEAGPADLSRYAIEDWLTLAIFWGMALCVFLQFFTRYALNNSLAWTEEIAANCLVVIVFLGSVMCVRMARHIQVDLLYRLMSKRAARLLQGVVDLIVVGFFAYITWLMWRYVAIVGSERMVTVDLPRGIVFYTVLAAFALMFLRALQNFIKDMINTKTVREQAEEADVPQGV
ncbi:TRAP transporter small permease [Pararhizobium antarcticum]|uniref:TRAP transporter small permease protein n=1 Tax=Pararhizobium antarcticum TaxID=1798805 RepID=A0A657LPK7_9HYPH|nr:TRAP transporter small permease [Pararhizobium antarcticum]OJF89893.1 ABC transporter permease [Rhizobium sp. 58]OJF92838.1 ABC transporter permease [Pararhizobium antarcticum]